MITCARIQQTMCILEAITCLYGLVIIVTTVGGGYNGSAIFTVTKVRLLVRITRVHSFMLPSGASSTGVLFGGMPNVTLGWP